MIEETPCVASISVFCGLGLAYAVYVFFMNNLGGELDNEMEKFPNENNQEYITPQDPQYNNHQNKYRENLKQYYKALSEQISSSALSLFKSQTLLMAFFALLFGLIFLIWLAEDDRSYLLLISFILGCICVAINTFLTIQFSIASIIRTAILPNDQSVLTFSYFNSSAISIATTSLSVLIINILIPSYSSILTSKEQNVKGYLEIFSSIFGYALGCAYGSLFYREAGGNCAKGLLVGKDMLSKSNYQSYDQTVIEVNLNAVSAISNIYNNNVISVLDFQVIFSAFVCAYLLLIGQSETIVTEAHCLFYLPLFIIGLSIITSSGSSFLSMLSPPDIPEDSSIPEETAKQVRLQVLVCNIAALIGLLATPVFFVPDGFTIGSTKKGEKNTLSNSDISPSDAIVAFIAGLAAQTLLIVYSEIFTSHFFSSTKEIAAVGQKHKKGQFSLTMLTAYESAGVSQIVVFFLFGIIIMLGYLLSGLFGIACCILGLISSPFSLMSVNILSSLITQSFEIAGISYLKEMREKLLSYSWSSCNFSIYTQIVSVMAVILTNILCIGLCVFITQEYEIYFWDAYGIFGFLYGASLAYFIKGIGLQSIKKVAESIRDGYYRNNFRRAEQSEDNKPIEQAASKEIERKSNLKDIDGVFKGQFQSVIVSVCINILVSVGSIALIGIFFGLETLIAFALGLNLVGVFLCFNSLIVGYSVKNAREYSRNYSKLKDVDEAPVQSDITVSASEGIPGTLLVTYLVFITLFVLLGASKWSSYGFFRQWVTKGEFNKLAHSATTGYMDSIKNAFDGEIEDTKEESTTTTKDGE